MKEAEKKNFIRFHMGRLNQGVFRMVLSIANLTSLIFGIIFVYNNMGGILWNFYGLLMILTLLGNLVLILISVSHRKTDYAYLMLFTISMLAVPISNTVTSSAVADMDSRSLLSYILFFTIFLLGEIISGTRLLEARPLYPAKTDLADSGSKASGNSGGKVRTIIRWIIIALLMVALLISFYIPYDLLGKDNGGIMEVFIPEYSFFYGMFLLGTACLIVRLNNRKCKSTLNPVVLAIGFVLFIICTLPLASVPGMINDSGKAYAGAFGPEAANMLRKDSLSSEFRSIPFSIPEYFFASPSENYEVQENVLYYEGNDGVDKGIKLYMDAYTPPAEVNEEPGNRSVLIRIHGGTWTIGDKGAFNGAQMNKYFAGKGYVVFDIQYGLYNGKKYVEFADVPANVPGNFSMDDIIRHIGLFTKYIADHREDYNANLDSVFISGGSAGGQLALATGLSITGEKYSDLMDGRLNVRGIIPFYPANDMADGIGIQGTEELVNPALLVEKDSPPCLIYQGTHDGIVNPDIAEQLRNTYLKKGNSKCALLFMTFGSHASDFYYSGYYNQIFMYYMERFMYQFS